MLSQVEFSGVNKLYSFDRIPTLSARGSKEEGLAEKRRMLLRTGETMLQVRDYSSCCCRVQHPVGTLPPSASTYPEAVSLKSSRISEACCKIGANNVLSKNHRLASIYSVRHRQESFCSGPPGRRRAELQIVNCVGSASSREKKYQTEDMVVRDQHKDKASPFVRWFRESSPYIQGHRKSTFVVVIPGEVIVDSLKMDGILQVLPSIHVFFPDVFVWHLQLYGCPPLQLSLGPLASTRSRGHYRHTCIFSSLGLVRCLFGGSSAPLCRL
jgi:hypothetical protein